MTTTATDPRFQRLGLKLGLFIGAGLLLGITLLAGMALRQGYFSPKTPVFFVAASGSDLRPGMAVKLSGFKIGQVRQISLNDMARVDVEMAIEDRHLQWIKSDSVATLAREGVIGDSYISISSGKPSLPPLVQGERLRFELGRGLGDIAEDVRQRVIPVIDGMQTLLQYANDPKGDLRAGLAQMRLLATELRTSRQQLDRTLASLDHLSRNEASATFAQAKQTLEQADARLRELEAALPLLQQQASQTLKALEQTAATAGTAASEAEQLLRQSRPQLQQVLGETDALLRDSRAAVKAARGRWPFSGPDVTPTSPAPPTTP